MLFLEKMDTEPEEKKQRAAVAIREMRIDDIPAVFHLGECLFTSDQPNLYRNWEEFEVIGAYYDDPDLCVIAERDDTVVGFILGTTIQKPRSAWKYGYLVWMGVSEDVQAQGVGERLFARFVDIMIEHGVRMILMDTDAENEAALNFFRKQGFGKPEHHVYLSLNISRQQREYREKMEGNPS